MLVLSNFEYSEQYVNLRKQSNYQGILNLSKDEIESKQNLSEAFYWHIHATLFLDNSAEKIKIASKRLENITEPIWKGRAIKIIGNQHTYKGNFDEAIKMYSIAEGIFKLIRADEDLSIIFNNYGYIDEITGNLTSAIDSYNKSIDLKQTKKDNEALLINIGKVNFKMNKLNEALKNFEEAEGLLSKKEKISALSERKYRIILTLLSRNDASDFQRSREKFLEISEIHNEYQQNYTKNVIETTEALILQRETSLFSKGKAMKLFESIINDETYLFPFKLVSYKSLIELKLAEIKLNEGRDVKLIRDFQSLINEFYELVENRKMRREMVDIQILKSKFAEITNNFPLALQELDKVNELVEKYHIEGDLERWKSAREELLNKIGKMKIILDSNLTMVQRIESSDIEEYLSLIKL